MYKAERSITASLFDDAFTVRLFARIAQEAGLETMPLGDGVRVSRRGALTYVFNYGDEAHTLAGVADDAFVFGSPAIEPGAWPSIDHDDGLMHRRSVR